MKKTIILLLISIISVIFFSNIVSAYCCTNPLSFGDICFDINYSEDIAKEMCCQESDYYGTSPRVPKSQEDCIENFFHENCEGEYCVSGCCFDLDSNTCSSDIPKSLCNGVFTTKLNGSCEKNGDYAFPICETGCCCTDYSFSLTTSRGCEGDFTPSVSSDKVCGYICQADRCIEGCQIEKPFFCKDDKIKKDCTGGDGIVGNGNDCGCPTGEECLQSGECEKIKPLSSYSTKKRCNEKGYLWCEEEGECVSSCTACPSSIKKENICVDSCTEITCGENSHCFEGECVCDEGFYDDACRAYHTQIDYSRDGCFRKEPCTNKTSNTPWWIFGISLIIFLIILFMMRKKKEKEKEPEQPYWQKYPPEGYENRGF